MTKPSEVVRLIDKYWEDNAEGHRRHLGASQIGNQCERALVYGFRHASTPKIEGRMLRLFKRGHLEEPRFFQYLRQIGFEVQEYAQRLLYHPPTNAYHAIEWEEPWPYPGGSGAWEDVSNEMGHQLAAKRAGFKVRQWGFKTHGDHFAGSTDGRAFPCAGLVYLPYGEPLLLECKTANTKSFCRLLEVAEACRAAESAVQKHQPKHYDQMQVYMHMLGLPRALYMAVNKNDDDLYTEVIEYRRAYAEALLEKAQRVILARQLPRRISDHPSWFGCKYCEHLQVCHYGAALEKKCRTCRHVVPVGDARFECGRWNSLIPLDVEPKGCDCWEAITD